MYRGKKCVKRNPSFVGVSCASNQILSRGQLVESIRKQRKEKQTILSFTIEVTKYMLPSFRIVAYYHVGTKEVVSDSVWVEVQTSCMGTVRHTHLHQHRLATREHIHTDRLTSFLSCPSPFCCPTVES